MWKLFILTFLCLFLTTFCDEDNSGDVKTTQVVAAAAAAGSSSDGNSGTSSSAAAVITTVKTEESSDPSSGSGNNSNSGDGSYYDGNGSDEDDEDKDCNEEERNDDYDCTSALYRVKLAIIKIFCTVKSYYVEHNYLDYKKYCDIKNTQGKEGHIGSPVAIWMNVAMISLYTREGSESQRQLFEDLLNIKNRDECRCVMKTLIHLLKPTYKELFASSSEIMAPYKYYFTDIFERDVKMFLDAKVQNSNFNKPLMSAKKANKYAAAKTKNVIRQVVPKQEASKVFNPDQQIINVIGTFLKPVPKRSYNTENMTKGIYYGLIEPTLTDYYNQDLIYNSTQSSALDSWVIEIPLNSTNTNCIVILPNSRCGLKPMLEKLALEPQILPELMKRMKCRNIKLSIPVFEKSLETVENVIPALQSTCKLNVFNSEAEIVDSCEKPLNRSVTYIHQKSTVKFTSVGAEPYKKASAQDCSECGETINICINRPAVFLYISNGVILESVIGKVERAEPCTDCFKNN